MFGNVAEIEIESVLLVSALVASHSESHRLLETFGDEQETNRSAQ